MKKDLTKFNLCSRWLALTALLIILAGAHEALAYDIAEYYPLRVEDTRLFIETESENGQISVEFVREPISRTETIGGVETYVSGELSGDCWAEEYEAMAWDSEGLKFYREVECDNGELEVFNMPSPVLIMPRQFELGQTLTWTAEMEGETLEMEATLEAVEDVTVQAGTFQDCLRLEAIQSSGDESETCRSWLAPDVGVVKEECSMTEDGIESTENLELVAAVINQTLYGSPVRSSTGEWYSFYLAQISLAGTNMLIENVVVTASDGTSSLWWVKFGLNTAAEPVAWTITDFGQGTPSALSTSSSIPGLDLSQALTKMNINDTNYDPQLWIRFAFGAQDYVAGFNFPAEKLSWDIYFLTHVAE